MPIVALLLLDLVSSAQSTINGRFYISGASEVPSTPSSNYSIEGTFTDPSYVFSSSDILIGDVIADNVGLTFRIDKIVSLNGDLITVDVTYLRGSANGFFTYPASYAMGTLFRPTSNGYALSTYDPEYTNDALKIAVLNSAILDIDKDVRGFQSGIEFPVTPKAGDLFYNTTEKKLYAYTENGYILVGGGVIPSGLSSEFPNPAKTGEVFFNKDDNNTYIYNGTIWLKISTNGSTPSGIFNPDPATVTVNEGSLFYNTSDHKLYVYNGTIWMPADNILPSGQIYVGNTTNVATPVSMSGDATIANSGKLTIKNGAVTDEKLDKINIPLNGFANPTDNVSLGDGTTNNRVVNVANPTAAQDAATKNYVDALFANPTTLLTLPYGNLFLGNISNKAIASTKSSIPLSGFGTAVSNILLGDGTTNYKIVNLANPTAAQDAASKYYVDTRIIDPASITLATGNLFVGTALGKAGAVAKSSIALSGFGTPSTDISLGDGTTNFKIVNLANPTAAQDAATKSYVDTKTLDPSNIPLATDNFFVGNSSAKATSTLKSAIALSGFGTTLTDISFGNFKLTNLGTPLTDNDAATKKYIDDLFLTPAGTLSLASGKLFMGNTSGKAVATTTSAVPVSAFGKATATINMGDAATQYNISYLAEPLYPQDAATKSYVDSKIASPGALALTAGSIFVGNSSNLAEDVAKTNIPISDFGVATASISLGNGTTNYKIINLATPTTDNDAATKIYVDSKSGSVPSGTTTPSSPSAGNTFYNTTDKIYYVYDGTQWVPVDNALPYGQLYVGDASGKATATLKNAIPISGFGTATADISMGSKHLTDLATPVSDADATTKAYVDARITAPGHGDNLGNHTATANLKMATYHISNDGAVGKGLSFDAAGNATFEQNITINGNFYTPSDQSLKTKVETLSRVLQNIDLIRGVRFEYKDQKKYAAGPKIGLIAQELQRVYPEMVKKGSDGYLKVDYTQLTGVLIQAVKEQRKQIKQQQEEINVLRERINNQQLQIDTILKKLR
ncbi:tail fiber domain-containing protein [Arcticibacter eurypsychrophilus]|uniref:tail fiber domain-containing protein n=1 Tax=Arcticibacter eurypsychrophilus TaxID=1434752 RepID=UPI000A7B1AAB|nr:tail fiber domain-containing protein [Arcticibacter eurypsychrophilus]